MDKVKNTAKGVTSLLVPVVSLLIICLSASQVSAQEMWNPGTSLDQAANGNGASDNFDVDATITWYQEGQSDSFSLSLTPASSESSSSAVAESSQSSVRTGGSGGGGGVRPVIQTRPSTTGHGAAPVIRPSRRNPPLPAQVTSSVSSRASARSSRASVKTYPATRIQPTHRPSKRSLRQDVLKRENIRESKFRSEKDPCAESTASITLPTWFAVAGAVAFGMARSRLRKARAHRQRAKRRKEQAAGHALCLVGILCLAFAAYSFKDTVILSAHAENTVPQILLYNGNLRKPNGTAVSTAHSIRFSYWNTSDAVPTDLTATGSINPHAPQYLGWYEEHIVTPNNNGAFSVKLGSIRPILDLTSISISDAINLHLQVEVKPSGMPDSAYELIDVKPADPLQDRTQILPVPFARNADLLDLRDTGTGSGSIPVLGSGGLLNQSMIPGGTNADVFHIDANNTSGTPTLQFGTSLTKTISYSNALSRFNFSDDLHIEGNLTVTGLINGVDVTNLTDASNTHLKVFSGAGLNISIAGGNYRMGGSTVTYAGATNIGVPANATSYVFFGSGGLQIRSGGFPTDENVIQLATVVTNGSGIQSVQDKRVFLSDTREQNVRRTLTPAFEGASYKADGTDNIGQLSILYDDATKSNYYAWTSTRSVLQDYDVVVAIALPQEFVRWQGSGALSVTYRTTSASSAQNALDVQLFDTAGGSVPLSGATNLAATSWTTATFNVGSLAGTWNANGTFILRLKMKAKDLDQIHIAAVKIGTVNLMGR